MLMNWYTGDFGEYWGLNWGMGGWVDEGADGLGILMQGVGSWGCWEVQYGFRMFVHLQLASKLPCGENGL